MIEKVSPMHPDKVADRIAGALVDYAYTQQENPKIAVEVLAGHGKILIIAETSVHIPNEKVEEVVKRISGENLEVEYREVPQDIHLAKNQEGKIRCGDNGIFKGVPLTEEEKELAKIAKEIYERFPTDGKFVLADGELTICQSQASDDDIKNFGEELKEKYGLSKVICNPLGEWTGGLEVDSGATNRKLGSDMAGSVTGGGIQGKELSKADVSVNIYAFLKAQELGVPVELHCSIGDESIGGVPYEEIVEIARGFISDLGGFEKLAEWGLF